MKKAFALKVLLLSAVMLTIISTGTVFSQSKKEIRKKERAAALRSAIVDSQHYVFRAETAIPSRGFIHNLSYGYEVVISAKKIDSYLPYFGIAYTSDYGATTSPLEFISTDFTYAIANGKKGGWEITIQTKDTKDFKKLYFTVFENGSASLQVVGNDRQPISFNGTAEPFKEGKK
jgi:hypothetical protein